MSSPNLWIGVDLDGTLAMYDGWNGSDHIGEPIPKMVERVKQWLAEGKDVKIFTARVSWQAIELNKSTHSATVAPIYKWSIKHIGECLDVVYQKDMAMVSLWDDRAVQVIPNTGERADGLP